MALPTRWKSSSISPLRFSVFGNLAARAGAVPAVPPLFDASFYGRQDPSVIRTPHEHWQHYCADGFRLGLNPHPLFDTGFYREQQLRDAPDANPLLHYLSEPNCTHDTHPLLDIASYVSQLGPEQLQQKSRSKKSWLQFLLDRELFDLHVASRELSTAAQSSVTQATMRCQLSTRNQRSQQDRGSLSNTGNRAPETKQQAKTIRSSPAIFDADFYLKNYPDIAKAKMDPWQHFCEYGFLENRVPHPIFHTKFYREKYLQDQPNVNPLMHYLDNRQQLLDTHPLFDAALYVSQIDIELRDLHASSLTPLEHFLRFNGSNLASPSPLFCSESYLLENNDIREQALNPLYHYLRYGKKRGRVAACDPRHLEMLRLRTERELALLSYADMPHQQFLTQVARLPDQPSIICVSHQASVTGAPLIVLKIAETLQLKLGVNIIWVVFRDGPLLEKFEAVGPVLRLNGANLENQTARFEQDMRLLTGVAEQRNVLGAIVNSAESRDILPTLKKAGIPNVALVHENANAYAAGKFDVIGESGDRVIFPSEYVRSAALKQAKFPETSTEVMPQGLLHEKLLQLDPHDPTNAIRKQHGIPSDATFVLACGTMDGRKGLDLFISTAIISLSEAPEGSLYFGWLGGSGHRSVLDQFYWLQKDIAAAGIGPFIKLLGQTDSVGPYLQACDMLYLPSRMDPFPCVVNEAMAVEKPVVLFDNASGCVPLIEDKGGAVVPYGNVALASRAIQELARYPQLRRQMGERNRAYVAKHLNFDQYVDRVVDSLASVMRQPEYEVMQTDAYAEFHSRVKSEQPRIIFTLPSWKISGVNTFVENLITQLQLSGYDASILFTTRHPSMVDQERMPRVPYRFLSAKPMSERNRRERVAEYLKANAPCVFVPNFDYTSSSISHQLPDDVAVLGVLHSDDDEHYLHGYQMGHYWDSIVAVSETIKDKFLKLNPAFADRLEVIRYGIPVNLDAGYRREPSKRLRLIYTGRIVQTQKRIFDFLELIEKLDATDVPFEITFVGGGVDEEAFQSRLKPWIYRGVARYLGDCGPDQVVAELKQHDALLLMSEFEGLPLSLLEAMSHRCVPIVTDIPSGVGEILTHDHNSLLSPFGDVDAMVGNIVMLQQSREKMEALAENSFQTLLDQKLTDSQMADQYVEILNQLFRQINGEQQPKNVPLNNAFVRGMLKVA